MKRPPAWILALAALALGWIWGSRTSGDLMRDIGRGQGFRAGYEAGLQQGREEGYELGARDGWQAARARDCGSGDPWH